MPLDTIILRLREKCEAAEYNLLISSIRIEELEKQVAELEQQKRELEERTEESSEEE